MWFWACIEDERFKSGTRGGKRSRWIRFRIFRCCLSFHRNSWPEFLSRRGVQPRCTSAIVSALYYTPSDCIRHIDGVEGRGRRERAIETIKKADEARASDGLVLIISLAASLFAPTEALLFCFLLHQVSNWIMCRDTFFHLSPMLIIDRISDFFFLFF